jgi:uncharacterized membrane protein YkoI
LISWHHYKGKAVGRVLNKDIFYEVERDDDGYNIIVIANHRTSLVDSGKKSVNEAKGAALEHCKRKLKCSISI